MRDHETWTAMISADEKTFFKLFGKRIAELRKEQGLTQVQMAEALGVSQQQVASFEVGRRRVPISMLPPLAHALSVTVEELLGETPKTGKRGPAPKLQQKLQRVAQLSRSKQRFVLEMLDTALQHDGR